MKSCLRSPLLMHSPKRWSVNHNDAATFLGLLLAPAKFVNSARHAAWPIVARFRPASMDNGKTRAASVQERDKATFALPWTATNQRRARLQLFASPHRPRQPQVDTLGCRPAARRQNRQNLFPRQIVADRNGHR